jgi:general secretion pathway protein I
MRRHTGSRTVAAASFTNRSGLSLLEIIISVAIFMASLAAIMEGLQIGRRSELSARLQSEAVLRCETVLGEILSGVKEAASAQGNPFDDDETGNWEWTAEVTEAGTTGLLQVTVLVEHRPGGEEPNAAFTLVRFMRDPQLFLDAALQESE